MEDARLWVGVKGARLLVAVQDADGFFIIFILALVIGCCW